MSILAAWVLFPALLLALSIGCGLGLERLSGLRLPGPLIPATGLAVIVVLGQFLTLSDLTAELTTPLAVTLAVVGIGLGWRGVRERIDGWAVATALVAYAAFAAPIVLSGDATFAGYIKLDDTATWMALTDRVMEAGRSLDGLAPSSYEATLAFNLGEGYPVGVFLPLGAATLISGQDVAWTIQPYMATLGAILALGLWQIAASLVTSRPLRSIVALAGSQSALLFGYYLWGGVKEIAAAALLASAVPLATFAVGQRGAPRSLLPLAVVCSAVVGVLSVGGVLWLAPVLAGALALLVLAAGLGRALRSAAWCAGLVALLSLPVLLTGGLLPPTSSPLTSADARGNLIAPLDLSQVAGIWPIGDFRLRPDDLLSTRVLIAVAAIAGAGALVYAWRRRRFEVPLYVGGALLAALVIYAIGSPWVDGKALATASPAIPFAASLGAAVLFAGGRRVEGAVLLVVVVGAIAWSNALQYRDLSLAPRDQLAELEEIGGLIEDQGPTLMTEYQPYGVRHFLRDADPEAASELRRRQVSLAAGGTLTKGEYADIDRFDLNELLVYRTLVLRRGPDQSRPPAPYRLLWRGEFYEVWQRPETAAGVIEHVGLGDQVNAVGRPSCAEVRELAQRAGPGGTLLVAARPSAVVASLASADYPGAWRRLGTLAQPVPEGGGDLKAAVHVPRSGEYEVWLRGSVRPEVELLVDGRTSGSVRHQLNNDGLFAHLGRARLTAGDHEVMVRFSGADLHPGSGGPAASIGPLVLSDSDASEVRVTEVPAAAAERVLCGREWDWIELPA